MTVRLLVIDDHDIVCKGLQALLEGSPIEVVACARTTSEALRQATESAPDVALLDVVLGATDGYELCGQLKEVAPGLPVVFYTAFDNPRFSARAAALGAAGFVLKSSDRASLIKAVEAAAAGHGTRVRRPSHRSADVSEEVDVRVEVALTEREQQVLSKLAEGLTNKQIAQSLEISYETVKEHVQHILQKVGVTDRTQAAVWAVRRGLL